MGAGKEEKTAALKRQLQELHRSGKIDSYTQVIVQLHGSIDDKRHELFNEKNEFSLDTIELVSLIRETAALPGQEVAANSWQGTIHLGGCGAGRASQDLKEGAGITLLYAGKKVKLGMDSWAIFKEIIRLLGEYRKNPAVNKFPSAQDFYAAAGDVSGEKVYMVGQGKLVQIRSGYLPPPTELTKRAVRAKLERSLLAKILHGKPETVQKMVDLLGSELKDIKEVPPLLVALNGHTTDAEEKIKILLRAGVDINQKFWENDTALHVACRSGKREMVSWLLRQGADIRGINKQGMSPLAVALCQGRMDLIDILIEAGADVNTTTLDGSSALHLACKHGDERLIEWLIQKGGNPVLRNKEGRTPLSNMTRHSQIAWATYLFSRRKYQ